MRLGDVDKLLYHKRKVMFFGLVPDDECWGFAVPVEEIDKAPTIDAVPVVRCRECIYYKICDEWETGKRMLCEIHHHSYLDHDGDEHFCSWGQRREAEHDKHPSDPL